MEKLIKSSFEEDLEGIFTKPGLNETDKIRLICVRVGQEEYRNNLMKL